MFLCASAIYSFFHRALVLHVFAKAVPELRSIDPSSVPMSHLHLSLEEIERQAHLNPLEEEMSLGMWHAEPARVGAEAERREAARGRERQVIGGKAEEKKRSFFPSAARMKATEKKEKAATVEEAPAPLQRASPPPPVTTKATAVDEQKFPSKGQSRKDTQPSSTDAIAQAHVESSSPLCVAIDESALQGSESGGKGVVNLPVHSESGGVPTLSTTQTASGEGVGEKIKSAFGGGKEKEHITGEEHLGSKAVESKGVESVGAEKPSLIEKVKTALGQ